MSEAYDDLLQWIQDSASERKDELEQRAPSGASLADEERGDAVEQKPVKLVEMDDDKLDSELSAGVNEDRLDEILAVRAMKLAQENPEILRGIQRREEEDERQRREVVMRNQERIDRENRARASAGLRELVPGGSFFGNLENKVIAAVQNDKTRVEELQEIRGTMAANLQKWETSDDFKRLPADSRKQFTEWGVNLLQSLSDAERLRKDRPNDLALWEESARAVARYVAEGEAAFVGFARMMSGDRVGKGLSEGYNALMMDKDWAMSARAGEGWKENGFNWNRFAVVSTSGTLSMAECIGGAYLGGAAGGALLRSGAAAGKAARGVTMAAKALPMVGWALPMTVKTAGQSFSDSMAYWQSKTDVSDSEKYWRSVGQAVTDATIEFVSEEASYALELGASKVAARLSKVQKPLEKMTLRAMKETLGKKALRIGLESGTSFLEEWGEEDFSSWGQELSKALFRRGDSEMWQAWKNEGAAGVGNWAVEQTFENAVGVISTLLTGAAHAARQYQWEGVQDWYSRPGQVAEDFGIEDPRVGQVTAYAVQTLLNGDDGASNLFRVSLEADNTEDAKKGLEIVDRIQSQAKRFGTAGLMDDARDVQRDAGNIDVVEFQNGVTKGNGYLVMIGKGSEVSSIAYVETAEQAAFLQEMARSYAIGTASPNIVQLRNRAMYAVKRADGGVAVYGADGSYLQDANKDVSQDDAKKFWEKHPDVQPLTYYDTLPIPAASTQVAENIEEEEQADAQAAANAAETAEQTAEQPATQETEPEKPVDTTAEGEEDEQPNPQNAESIHGLPQNKPASEAKAEHDAATMEPIVENINKAKEAAKEELENAIEELEEKQRTKGLSEDEQQELDRLKDALEDWQNPKSADELEKELENEDANPAVETGPAKEQEKPSEETKPSETPATTEEKKQGQSTIDANSILANTQKEIEEDIAKLEEKQKNNGKLSQEDTRKLESLKRMLENSLQKSVNTPGDKEPSNEQKTTKEKPTEAPKPAEETKPAEAPKPAEETRPVESPKPAEETKPSESPKPEESGNALEEQERQDAEKVRNMRQAIQRYIDLADDLSMSAAEKRRVLTRLANEDGISVKTAEEITEAMVVDAMRIIASNEETSLAQKWAEVKNLYEHQPNFSTRTSTSMINQAYSTPIPISFMGGIRIGGDRYSTVYEPTAGTGSLVAVARANGANIHVNELAHVRTAILERSAYYDKITQGDALATKNDAPIDIVMTNPPFANAAPMKFGDFTLKKLDHQIAAHALNDLKPDGRALVIVGANMRDDGAPTYTDHVFMNFLYTNFNVKDNYVLDGSLYRKQGATFPIRLITIDGRRKASDGVVESPTEIETIKSFDELYEKLKEELPHGQGTSAEGLSDYVYREGREGALPENNDRPDRGAAEDGGGVSGRGEQSVQPGGRGSGGLRGGERTEGSRERDGVRDGGQEGVRGNNESVGDTQSDASDVQGNREGMVQEPQSEGTEGGRELGDVSSRPDVQSGSDGSTRGMGGADVAAHGDINNIKVGHKVGDKYNAYISASKSRPIGSVVNTNLAEPLSIALNELQEAVGDVDEYVMQELGYDNKQKLYDGLAAEQIDGVALAIRQLSQNYGFLIGDVTGLGKGRQAAAIIRWAQKHGKLPIFFTEKPSLFSSMYYDGQDIDSDFHPLLMGNPKEGKIFSRDGGKLLFSPYADNKDVAKALDELAAGRGKFDCLFTNYSQFNRENSSAKKLAFDNLLKKRDVVFILDEAHNAAGDSQTGKAIQDMISQRPVLYSSATAIKRADNLPLYYRLKIFTELVNNDLVEILKGAGPVLMQLFTQKLVSDGSYVRRERDLSEVSFDMKTVEPKNFQKVKSDADKLSHAFREILAFSEMVKVAIATHNKYAKTKNSGTLTYQGFGSALHNFVSQYLLAAKIDSTVDEAISAMKRGEKVVIALTNTMESVLKDFIDGQGLSKGDVLNLSYADVIRRYVSGVNGDGRGSLLTASEKDKTGDESHPVQYTPDDLGLRSEYDYLVSVLEDVLDGIDFALSPIDLIEAKIRQAGYDVGEITKREYVIDYDLKNGTSTLNKRSAEATNDVIFKFNEGGLDCLILNAAGSTGISLHASEKIRNETERNKPRHMIMVQPSLDINTVIQTLGRINRTGQVKKPFFTFLSTPLTAEIRPNFMLAKKMRSLGAATSGDQKGDVDLGTDFINEYGDTVAAEWLVQNDDLRRDMGLPEPSELHGEVMGSENLMARLTGRTVLFDDATQAAVFDELSSNYNEKIDELKRLGKYTLDVNEFDDWDAIVKNVENVTEDVDVRQLEVNDKVDIPSEKQVMAEFDSSFEGKPGDKLNAILIQMRQMVTDMPKLFGKENGKEDEQMPVKQKKELDDINDFVRKLRDLFEVELDGDKKIVKPRVLKMNIGGTVYPVALIGFKAKLTNKRHPGNQGQVKLKFAVADSLQRITVPASKIKRGVNGVREEYGIEFDWRGLGQVFTGERKTVRAERYVFTGDLIFAYRMSGNQRQLVARYSYRDGQDEVGLIQPKGWKPANMVHDPRLDLDTVEAVQKYLADGGYRTSVFSRDGVLKITKGDGYYNLRVPAAARLGGRRYALDEDVLAVTGNWWRTRSRNGQYLQVDVEEANVGRLLDVYYGKGISFRMPNGSEASSNSYRVGSGEAAPSSRQIGLTKEVVQELSNRLGFGVNVVDGDEELPYNIREDVYSDRMNGYLDGDWKGIYRDGVCFINARAHANERDAVVSILHEAVVHRGLRCLFNSEEELNKFLDRCYDGFMRLKAAADTKQNAGLDHYKAIEEAIADFSDNEQYAPIYKKIYDWIRTAIAKVLNAVGLRHGLPDDAELREILKEAGKAARERAPYDSNSPASLYTNSSELERRFPNWRSNMTTGKGGHKTQIAGTVATYGKIGEHLLSEGFDGRILDASSGKGIGTAALREMGFEVDDVEPYAERGYNPTYRSYDDVKGRYDLVISNAVLNVVEDDIRDRLLGQMAGMVAPGGRLFINVRPASAIETGIKHKVELDSPSEVMVPDNNGKPQSYQKGFAAAELTDYVQKALGDGFKVAKATAGNIGTAGGVAVVATRDGVAPSRTGHFGKVYYRTSLASTRQAMADWVVDVLNGDFFRRMIPWGEHRGGVRPWVNRTMWMAKGELNAEQEAARVVLSDLNVASKAIKKESWSKDVYADLDELLRDRLQPGAVSHASDPRVQNLIAAVMRGRKAIDAISLRIASEMGDLLPLATGLAIQNNVGKYTIRSYEKFLNPKYKPSQDVIDNAKAAIETEFYNRFEALKNHVNTTNYTQGAKRQLMLNYLVTRDDNLLNGQSKAFVRKARIFATLIDRASTICNDAITAIVQGSDLAFDVDTTMLSNTVQGTVDMLLEKDVENAGYGDRAAARWKIARQSFLHRKDLPDWLRDLYGEITDYGASIATTTNRGNRVLVMNKMYRELLDYNTSLPMDAKDRVFYDAPYTDANKRCNVRMDGFGFGVLRGMYTDRNTYKMLNAYSSESNLPIYVRRWIAAMRMSKTVLNVPTHMRNVVGNVNFAIGDGEILRNPKAYSVAFAHGLKVLAGKDDASLKERQELMRLGVIGAGAHAEMYSRTMEELLKDYEDANGVFGFIVDFRRKYVNMMETLYGAEDNMFRAAAYYAKVDRGMGKADAAEEVNNLYPTYDRAPAFADEMRKKYFFAPDFIHFRLEAIRCLANEFRMAYEGAKHGDFWRVAGLGMNLLASTSVSASKVIGLLFVLGRLFGKHDDEDDKKKSLSYDELNAMRILMPDYRENNLIWPWRANDGSLRYVDAEYFYPFEQLSFMASMALSSAPLNERANDAWSHFKDNYLFGGIIPTAIAEQKANSNRRGGKITEDDDSLLKGFLKRVEHAGETILPPMAGFAWEGIKILWEGDDKLVDANGEVRTAGSEFKKMVMPMRVYQLDPEMAYVRKMRRLSYRISQTKGKASAVVHRWDRGEVSKAEARRAIDNARDALKDSPLMEMVYAVDKAGQTLGIPPSRREQLLRKSHFSIENARRIINGYPLEYKLPKSK